MTTERILHGDRIFSEADFHREIAFLLAFGEFYGSNLDALWDRLSTDVERPVLLVWRNSQLSKQAMASAFDRILEVFDRVKRQDEEHQWDERFDYRLE